MVTSLSRPKSSGFAIRQSYDLVAILLLATFMLFGPFLETIALGQVNALALFLILASLLLSELDRQVLAGISLGTAILLKTSPALFIVYFLLIRRYRVVLTTLATALLLTLLAQIPFTTRISEQFISIVPRLSNELHPSLYNQSASSMVFRLLNDFRPSDLNTIIPAVNKMVLGVLTSV